MNSAQRKKHRKEQQRLAAREQELAAASVGAIEAAEARADLTKDLVEDAQRREIAAWKAEEVMRQTLVDVRRELAQARVVADRLEADRDAKARIVDGLQASLDEALRDLRAANDAVAKLRAQDSDATSLRRRLQARSGELEEMRGQLYRLRHVLRAVARGELTPAGLAQVEVGS